MRYRFGERQGVGIIRTAGLLPGRLRRQRIFWNVMAVIIGTSQTALVSKLVRARWLEP
jgi:hypothetical protein